MRGRCTGCKVGCSNCPKLTREIRKEGGGKKGEGDPDIRI